MTDQGPADAERRQRAQTAKRELAETDAAFAKMRESAVAALFASQMGDVEYRERLYRAVNTIDTVQRHLKALIQDGEFLDLAEALKAEG